MSDVRTGRLKVLLIGWAMAALLFGGATASAQTRLKEGTGSISGRVTLGDKAVQGVVLTLRETTTNERRAFLMLMQDSGFEKATSDEDGRYHFKGLAEGAYEVTPFAPALVAPPDKSSSVAVAEGQAVEDVDFALSKGGAITGRVTTADGRPVVMESVQATRVDKPGAQPVFAFGFSPFKTDDRGIYRIYGLPPGRYKVSVGRGGRGFDMASLAVSRPDRPQTFHPGVTDEARASMVELKAGGEVSDVDIKLGDANKTYSASGRVVDAETGKPLANAMTAYRGAKAVVPFEDRSALGSPTSSSGEFRLEGLTPGTYTAFAMFGLESSSEFYSDALEFEVKHQDVTGLEIKAHRGASINGIAVLEGTNDPAARENASRAELFAIGTESLDSPNFARSRLAADGSFHLGGLKPGKTRLVLQDFTGLRLRRIERNGVPQQGVIDLAAGEHVTDLRVVFAYGSGIIRGQVKIEGGTLPKGAQLSVVARLKRADSSTDDGDSDDEDADVDAAGRFLLEDLSPGEYEVTVVTVLNPLAPATARDIRTVRQSATVTEQGAVEMVIILDLGRPGKRD